MTGARVRTPRPKTFLGRLTARLNHFQFESVWVLQSRCEDAFHTLQDLSSYPSWWPEVKKVSLLDDASAAVVVRAVLPYTLRFRLSQKVADARAGVLEAWMTGDLEGWSRWSLISLPEGCGLKFEEDVQVNRPLLKALSPVARPVLKANHLLMMRRGEKGLRHYLCGIPAAPPELQLKTKEDGWRQKDPSPKNNGGRS